MSDKTTGFPISDNFLNRAFNSLEEGVTFFFLEDVLAEVVSLELWTAFSFLSGAEKSISDIGAKGTFLKMAVAKNKALMCRTWIS